MKTKKAPKTAPRKKSISKKPGARGNASEESLLRGWAEIAGFLGQPVTVAQRWAKNGMPVQRKGRSIAASAHELGIWLAREAGAGAPVHLAQESDDDLLKDLRRGLKEARTRRKQ